MGKGNKHQSEVIYHAHMDKRNQFLDLKSYTKEISTLEIGSVFL